jgi:hypothetical protein
MTTPAGLPDWLLVIAEDEDGGYEPVALVSTPNEAEQFARSDFARRLRLLEQGRDAGLCPCVYRTWARRAGLYESAGGILP